MGIPLTNGNRLELVDEFTGENKSITLNKEKETLDVNFGTLGKTVEIGSAAQAETDAQKALVDAANAQAKADSAYDLAGVADGKADDASALANTKLAKSGHLASSVIVADENGTLQDNFITDDNVANGAAIASSKILFSQAESNALNSGVTSSVVSQVSANEAEINAINAKIPAQASEQNQLADRDFVNSTAASATSTFRGTYNSLQELEAYSGQKDNNDYAFVIATDQQGNTVYNRYKYDGSAWVFEYALNNSSFTAAQWATINSGLTSQTAVDIEANASAITTLNGDATVSGSVDNKIAGALGSLGDDETVGSNSYGKLEAIAVKEKNKNLTLPLWHGSKEEWLGEPDTWYNYKRGNENSFSLTNGQYRPMDYSTYEQGDPVNFYAPLGCIYYDTTRIGLTMTEDKKVRLTTASIGQYSSSLSSSAVSTDTLPDDIGYNMQQAFMPFGTNTGYFYNKTGLLDQDNITLTIAKGSFTRTSGPDTHYNNVYGVNITPIKIDVSSIVSGNTQWPFNIAMMRRFNNNLCIFTDVGLITRVSDSEWTVTSYDLTNVGDSLTKINSMGGLFVKTEYTQEGSTNVVYTTCKLDNSSDAPYWLLKTTDGYTWEKVKEVPGFIFDDDGSIGSSSTGCFLSTDSSSDVFGYHTNDFNTFTELAYQLNDGSKISDYIFVNSDVGTHYIGINQKSHYDQDAQQTVITTKFIWSSGGSRLNWYGMSVDGLNNTFYLTGGTAGYRRPLIAFYYNSSFSYGDYSPIIVGGGTYYIVAKYMRNGGKEMYVHSAEPQVGDQIYILPFKPEIGNTVRSYNPGSTWDPAYISTSQSGSFSGNSAGNKNFYTTISDTHPEYACLIDGEMLVMGGNIIANNISAGTGVVLDNGSLSVKDYSKFLKNGSTKSQSLSIGNTNDVGFNNIAFGYNASTPSGYENIALGLHAKASSGGSIAIGSVSSASNAVQATGSLSTSIGAVTSATGSNSVALGAYAKATASNAIQLGQGTNSTSNTLQVGSYTLLNTSTGKVPLERLAASPSSTMFLRGDGTWATPGSGITVDQTFDATSANPQSGKAIAGAGFASSGDLTSAITDLTSAINDKVAISVYNTKMTTVDNSITNLSTGLSSTDSTVSGLSTSVGTNTSSITTINNTIGNTPLPSGSTTLTQAISALASSIGSLSTNLGNLNTEVTNIVNTIQIYNSNDVLYDSMAGQSMWVANTDTDTNAVYPYKQTCTIMDVPLPYMNDAFDKWKYHASVAFPPKVVMADVFAPFVEFEVVHDSDNNYNELVITYFSKSNTACNDLGVLDGEDKVIIPSISVTYDDRRYDS